MTSQAIGGHARAAALSPERRKEIAINAARARWDACKTQQTSAQENTDRVTPASVARS
jgi:hypothetical protein